jgi:Na+-translocating ferredoxin:NAD+ oxidoreductase RnfC subunit
MTLKEIEKYGIVGAGGAGFPTHVKLDSKPDTFIMNAAECEPLLHKDMALISNFSDTVISGMKSAMELTGAKRGIIGIKRKHQKEIELLKSKISGSIEVIELDDVYPAGDEITLIYMTTKQVVQPGSLPISVGCVVQNVETLFNIGNNKPVVDKYISVAGAVEEPSTIVVPIGTTYAEVISKFKITINDYKVISGGLMMGTLVDDLNQVVTKRTGALIILPSNHQTVNTYNKYSTDHSIDIHAKAGCDQCSFCTELCPRYLLGHPIDPAKSMQNRIFSREEFPMINEGSFACCECNLCTIYACPEGLDPRGAALIEKKVLREEKHLWNGSEVTAHPMIDYRGVPTKKLMQRLDVLKFKDEGPFKEIVLNPMVVRIPLSQHIGASAKPTVSKGASVKKFDLIAEMVEKVSVNIHASIDGVVTEVTSNEIIIQRN